METLVIHPENKYQLAALQALVKSWNIGIEKYPFSTSEVEIKKNEVTKKNITPINFLEELEYETYPYKPSSIIFENTAYNLNKRIDCKVDFEDEMYIIQNQEFDITVWGNTREDAETSFAFTFHSLYQNFAIEDDTKLSVGAKTLKQKLLKTVKKVLYEGQKS